MFQLQQKPPGNATPNQILNMYGSIFRSLCPAMERHTVRPAGMIFSSQDVKHATHQSQVTIKQLIQSHPSHPTYSTTVHIHLIFFNLFARVNCTVSKTVTGRSHAWNERNWHPECFTCSRPTCGLPLNPLKIFEGAGQKPLCENCFRDTLGRGILNSFKS